MKNFGKIESRSVEIISVSELTQFINSQPMKIVNSKTLNPEQIEHLNQISNAFLKLSSVQKNMKINVSMYSDCQGSVLQSNQNGAARLTLVKQHLSTQGVHKKDIIPKLVECINLSLIHI